MNSYWLEQGGVIVDNIAKYAAACHAAGRGVMDDDDAQFEARMRLDAVYASISKALDAAEQRGAERERAKVLPLVATWRGVAKIQPADCEQHRYMFTRCANELADALAGS